MSTNRWIRWLAALGLTATCLVAGSACATSSQGSGSQVAQGSDEGDGDDDGDEIVCRTERPTGSNIAQRVCYNRSEVEDRSEADQQGLRDSGRYGCEGPGCTGGD